MHAVKLHFADVLFGTYLQQQMFVYIKETYTVYKLDVVIMQLLCLQICKINTFLACIHFIFYSIYRYSFKTRWFYLKGISWLNKFNKQVTKFCSKLSPVRAGKLASGLSNVAFFSALQGKVRRC